MWLRSLLAASWLPALVTTPRPRGWSFPWCPDRLRSGFGRLPGTADPVAVGGRGEARDDAQPCATPASSAHADRAAVTGSAPWPRAFFAKRHRAPTLRTSLADESSFVSRTELAFMASADAQVIAMRAV